MPKPTDFVSNGSKRTSGSGKWSKYQPRRGAEKVTWGAVDNVLLGAVIEEVTASGAALLFGTTRDGGALVLTICDGAERLKLYATSVQEMDDHMHGLIRHSPDGL